MLIVSFSILLNCGIPCLLTVFILHIILVSLSEMRISSCMSLSPDYYSFSLFHLFLPSLFCFVAPNVLVVCSALLGPTTNKKMSVLPLQHFYLQVVLPGDFLISWVRLKYILTVFSL